MSIIHEYHYTCTEGERERERKLGREIGRDIGEEHGRDQTTTPKHRLKDTIIHEYDYT